MKKLFVLILGMFAFSVFAQAVVAPVAPQDFLSQVITAVKAMGGMSTMLKISAVIVLIIASMKVSIINQYVWSKLGTYQIWVAPVMGLIAGLLSVAGGGPVTLGKLFAYVAAGGGAVFMHEILDMVKTIPGLGAIYVTVINLIETSLGGPAAQEIK